MEIGIFGMGAMGRKYAEKFAEKGYLVHGTDIRENIAGLKALYDTNNLITIHHDGRNVARLSDIQFYSVPVGEITNAVKQYGPSTKLDAIVGGQCSVKTPEITAFEEFLPEDAHIVTSHSLHGPAADFEGQTLASIRYRASDLKYATAMKVFAELGSNIVEMDYDTHDKATADTQAVTHLGFLSMGTAWRKMGGMPWDDGAYIGGIDNTKILMMLRIHGGTPHVYSGLAIHNPHAKRQVQQYNKSVSELFEMMISGNKSDFRNRVGRAGAFVFGSHNDERRLMLDDGVLGEYSLGYASEKRTNSHLSLFAMLDAWNQLQTNPYDNMICQTPPFKLRLGIAEYLARDVHLLGESVDAAMNNLDIRKDDLAFTLAVNEWASVIEHDDIDGYHTKFEKNRKYFEDKIPDGKRLSGELISRLK